jgi:hypothetical protein
VPHQTKENLSQVRHKENEQNLNTRKNPQEAKLTPRQSVSWLANPFTICDPHGALREPLTDITPYYVFYIIVVRPYHLHRVRIGCYGVVSFTNHIDAMNQVDQKQRDDNGYDGNVSGFYLGR